MIRLDKYLVDNHIFSSRNKAQFEIKEGNITVNGEVVTKASYIVTDDDVVNLVSTTLAYISKGGMKLEHALRSFHLEIEGFTCLDIGASTGGFTDCLLKHGAEKVYTVDTGTNQLHHSLQEDSRVISFEQTNILDTSKETFDQSVIDCVVMDVSFVSVTKIIPHFSNIADEHTQYIVLIKPQFEVGRNHIGKHGVVKDKRLHVTTLEMINDFLIELGYHPHGLIPSPIKGGSGNIEYLIFFNKQGKTQLFDYNKIVNHAFFSR